MKRTTTAVLLSAFLFPGAGDIYLRRYFSAAIIGAAALTALYLLMSTAIEKAQNIVDRILAGEVAADPATIIGLVVSQPVGSQAQLVNIATLILVLSWLAGIASSFLIGRADERKTGANRSDRD